MQESDLKTGNQKNLPHRYLSNKNLSNFSKVIILLWLILLLAGFGNTLIAKDDTPENENTLLQEDTQPQSYKQVSSKQISSKQVSPKQVLLKQILNDNKSEISLTDRFMSIFGLIVMLAIAYMLSSNRKKVRWSLVAWGVSLQVLFAILILKTDAGKFVFVRLTDMVNLLLGFTEEGARFIFGNLVMNNVPVGQPLGDINMGPIIANNVTAYANTGAYFAFSVLPTIIFFSSLMSILYHLGIMQIIVKAMAFIMRFTMKISAAESLSAAANVFVGMTEAPLVIKPYINKMTNSELMAVMTGGFATIAGGVLAAYVGMLRHVFPDIAGHLIAASVMSAPAALVVAKIMLPETSQPEDYINTKIDEQMKSVNVIDAAAKGAGDGLKLALNVGAMLLAFVALVAMLNFLIATFGGWFGFDNLSFQLILSWLFWPIAFVMGIPISECGTAAMLLGEKIVLNEFIAYLHLADLLTSGTCQLSYRTMVILTYALCGFANFGSIAVQLGGIGTIAESRRGDLARLGLRAMTGGALAAFMTATIAGMIL